ncbi:MAG: hypothetical protein KBG48_04540 [Kofleriaceae bacterium]|nr:hypothetical protein [Kofleriaceae bacterium]MBP9166628.1 hypothetical protein [Kofleriaceae bacterium]MBP9858452.1 hypothetical protein [Kofleriaceae bacterium]
MSARLALPVLALLVALSAAAGVARARPKVPLPVTVDAIRYVEDRACWRAVGERGCNVHGCWKNDGGCNVHGCWDGPRGSCNVHGCSDLGTCTVHGCPRGKAPRPRQVCVAIDELPTVLGFDPEAGGGCNVHGCWKAGGGCNVHGCWDGPRGSCNVHGCSDLGACSVHGCP